MHKQKCPALSKPTPDKQRRNSNTRETRLKALNNTVRVISLPTCTLKGLATPTVEDHTPIDMMTSDNTLMQIHSIFVRKT